MGELARRSFTVKVSIQHEAGISCCCFGSGPGHLIIRGRTHYLFGAVLTCSSRETRGKGGRKMLTLLKSSHNWPILRLFTLNMDFIK